MLCSFHQVELPGASSETIQSTFGRSFNVSTILFTNASWISVMAFGAAMDKEPVPPPSSIPLMLLDKLSGYPSPEQRKELSHSPENRYTPA